MTCETCAGAGHTCDLCGEPADRPGSEGFLCEFCYDETDGGVYPSGDH